MPAVFCEKGILRNFTKFTGKRLCQSLFFKLLMLTTIFADILNFKMYFYFISGVLFGVTVLSVRSKY